MLSRVTRAFRSLTPRQKVAIFLGGGALVFVLLCCGGVAVIGALFGDDRPARSTAESQPLPPDPAQPAAPAAEPSVAPTTAAAVPKQDKRIVTETQPIPYQTRTMNDPTLAKGTTKVKTQGVPGVETLTFEVTLVDGVQTAKVLLREEVTKQPVTKVVLVGTKETQNCDPNYIWACVPIAEDVDCLGGSGDGPAYVKGPVKVVGTDIYDLDGNDNDGIGCE